MISYDLPFELEEKIFEIKTNSDNSILKIISYFPLTELEKKFMKLGSLMIEIIISFSNSVKGK